MTDKTAPTNEDRRFARDWAEHIIRTPFTSMPMEAAAARVILNDTPAPAPALPGDWRLADHPQYGRIVVTNPVPTTDGLVHFVMPNPDDPLGYDWMFCHPAELTFLDDQEADQ